MKPCYVSLVVEIGFESKKVASAVSNFDFFYQSR